MSKTGKRIKNLKNKIDINKFYSIEEAIEILKNNTTVKFDETLDIVVKLGVNPQHSDQLVRGIVQLPHGTGKKIKVAVFAKGDKVQEALDAGADFVGSDELVAKIESGNIDFNKCIATPDMMALIGRVAKILGPKGLMPNAKLGSVTINLKDAVAAAKSGQVEFRVEKQGIIHNGIGKLSFTKDALLDNAKALFDALQRAKPAAVKGNYFIKAVMTSTMGVGLPLELSGIVK